jgi:pre-mRNA-processing factor 19
MYRPVPNSDRHIAHESAGTVYEKRLIEAYILENGVDPINGEALTVDDLIELKSQRIVRPRPPTLTSIPSLLSVFQEEWDALALETFTLKKSLAETRQELSTALYQHDAAVRVIARLTKERDEARDALSKVNVGARAPASNGDDMQVDSAGLPEAIVAKVESTQEKYIYQSSLLHPADNFEAFKNTPKTTRARRLGYLG